VKESIWTVSSSINKHATIAGGNKKCKLSSTKNGKIQNKKMKNQQKNAIVINKKIPSTGFAEE